MPDTLDTIRAQADATVTTAEQEATEAAGLVAALEDRVRDGDDTVTPEQITAARELGHFAQLRADATAAKAERAKEDARLAACEQLAQEMRTAQHNDETITAALTAFENALTNLTEIVGTHNQHIGQWRRRMHELAVPPSPNPTPGHGGLACDPLGAWVAVDGTRYAKLSAGQLVGATVYREAARCILADTADPDRRYDMRYRGEALSSTLSDLNGLNGPLDLRDIIRSAS